MIQSAFGPIDMSEVDFDHSKLGDTGYSQACAAEDTPEAMRDAAADALRSFPSELYVNPRDYAAKAEENNALKTWALNFLDRYTNQDPTHECVLHSQTRVFEACRNRQRGVIYGGPKKGIRLPESAQFGSVWVSPLSGYAECNPNKWGGTSLQKAMAVTVRRGLLPDKIQPAEYGFKHQLQGTTGRGGINQSSGDWIALRDFPDGWQDTAKHFKIEELILPEDAEQVISLVLNGLAVAVARNGHAIPYTHYDHEQQLMGYVDSYDVIRWDTMRTVKSAIGGAYAITAVTTPDDWNKPAG